MTIRFSTPDAYLTLHGRTPQQDGLVPGYHMVRGKKQWGVLQRITPQGEVELTDEEEEGVESVHEVESGTDELTPEQHQCRFDAIARGLDATLDSAVTIALQSTAIGGAVMGGSEAATDEEAVTDTDSGDDIFALPPIAPLTGAVVPSATPQGACLVVARHSTTCMR